MFVISQTPAPPPPAVGGGGGGVLSTQRCSLNSALKFSHPIPPLFSSRRPPNCSPVPPKPSRNSPILVANTEANSNSPAANKGSSSEGDAKVSLVGEDSVPLEGVIQFEKPSFSDKLDKWGSVKSLSLFCLVCVCVCCPCMLALRYFSAKIVKWG